MRLLAWLASLPPGIAIEPTILTSTGGGSLVVFSDGDPRYPANVARDLLAVDVTTGEVALRSRGEVASYSLPFEPCADDQDACSAGYSPGEDEAPFRWDLARYEARSPGRGDSPSRWRASTPRTGEATWSQDLTTRSARRFYLDKVVPLAPDGVVVDTSSGPVAVDYLTGETNPVDPETVLICAGPRETLTIPEQGPFDHDHLSGTPYFACDVDAQRVSEPPSAWAVSALPEVAPGWRVMSLGNAVVAMREP